MNANRSGFSDQKAGFDIKIPNIKLEFRWVVLAFIVLWIFSGIYTVGPDEAGVVRRFGKHVRSTGPGMQYHLPSPIERVNTPKILQVRRVEIGFRTLSVGPPARYREVPEEALMLTGDENIVKAEFIVQYRIRDAEAYLFNVKDPDDTVRDAAEAALRQVIGSHKIDEALTAGKAEIQDETLDKLQEILEGYTTGLMVVAVQLQDVHPPDAVVQAFKDVASAKEDKQRFINEAEGYRNNVIPAARGEAARIEQESEAYSQTRIKRAEGEAERFLKLYGEYRKSKEVTRQRLYLETIEQILPDREKVIVPDRALPLLNIGVGEALRNLLSGDQGGVK